MSLKPPPAFVTNTGAWEYVLAKLRLLEQEKPKPGKPRLDEYGNPLNYAAACAIYKNVVKKYAAFGVPNLDLPKIKAEHNNVADLDNEYPVGSEFFCDDMIVRAQDYDDHGIAVYPDSDGNLLIQVRVLDVDPEGANRNLVDHIIGVDPNRCCQLVEA